MKIYSLAIKVAMILTVSCNNSNKGETNIIYSVKLERDIDNISSVHLSNLGSKLQYIPLETNPACVIREISNLTVVDSFLFVSDNFRLLLFNKSGKFLQQIGTVGRGPGEYERVRDFAVSSSNKEIYVLTGREVLIYNFKGHFIRSFNLGFPCVQLVLSSNDELVIHRVNIPVASENYSLYILDRYGKVKTRIPRTRTESALCFVHRNFGEGGRSEPSLRFPSVSYGRQSLSKKP